MIEEFAIRDQRNGSWYWIDKGMLRWISREGGPSCLVVYNFLACFANNNTQKCFPSFSLLIAESGLSRASIGRAIKKLVEIEAIKRDGEIGKRNVYTLVAVETSLNIRPVSKMNQYQIDTTTSIKNEPEPVSKLDRNKTKEQDLINKTNTIVAKTIFKLPDWIEKETWDAFIDMRKRIRASPTERAKELLIKKLEGLKASGEDPNEVLNQSIMNNWKGLFEVKGNGGTDGRFQKNKLTAEEVYRRDYEAAEKVFGATRT